MPQLNPWNPGQYVAGGAGGIVSVNQQPIYGPVAAGWNWLSRDTILTPFFIDGQPDVTLREITASGALNRVLLTTRGISYAVGGGGHWAVSTVDRGVIIDGQAMPNMAPICYGPDGTLAWFPWNGQGLHLLSAWGEVTHLSDGNCQDVQVHGWQAVSWREESQIRHVGLQGFPAHPQTVGPAFGWLRTFLVNGTWWLAYQLFDRADLSVVTHPAHDAAQGKILATSGLCYRLDCNGSLAVWSGLDRDLPEDMRVVRLADLPMVAMGASPVPDPDPEPEPDPMPEIPNLLPIVQAVWTKYGGQNRGAMVNEIAWRGNGDTASGPWGLSRKTGGANAEQPRTGEKIGHDVVQHKPSGKLFDVFTDSGPIWAEAHPHNDPSRIWIPAVAPEGAPVPPPDDDPDTPPQPPSGLVDAAVMALIVAALEPSHARIAAMQQTIDILQAKVDAIQIPEPGPAFPERIALRSNHGRYLVAEDDHSVNAGRESAGPWETWTIEVK